MKLINESVISKSLNIEITKSIGFSTHPAPPFINFDFLKSNISSKSAPPTNSVS